MNAVNNEVYTIGHSAHPIGRFLELLRSHGISAVGDVRSHPYSRANVQFNGDTLKLALRSCGIAYVFLGKELGARPDNKECYRNGRVRYDLLAKTEQFKFGLERVKQGMRSYRLALMCAEKDPLNCHRAILVARQLEGQGVHVQHILANGNLETQEQMVERLLVQLNLSEPELYQQKEENIAEAYRVQGEAIAYEEQAADKEVSVRLKAN